MGRQRRSRGGSDASNGGGGVPEVRWRKAKQIVVLFKDMGSKYEESMEEVKQRSNLQGTSFDRDAFEPVDDNLADMDFEPADQKWFVWTLSHMEFPPRALRPESAALRIYAAFATPEEAAEHARALSAEDPSISLMVSPTYTWVAGTVSE